MLRDERGFGHPYSPAWFFFLLFGIIAVTWIPRVRLVLRSADEGRALGQLGRMRAMLRAWGDEKRPLPGLQELVKAGYVDDLPMVGMKGYHEPDRAVKLGAADDAGGWLFQPDEGIGQVFINCTHTDTHGSIWSAY